WFPGTSTVTGDSMLGAFAAPVRAAAFVLLLALSAPASAADPSPRVTTPKDYLGFAVGDDYHLASYKQLSGYWAKLAAESDRVKLVEIGKTEEGRPQLMLVVTSPANHAKLDRYRTVARRLALAEGVTPAEARALAAEGKA